MNDYLAASNATSLLDMANGAIKERIDALHRASRFKFQTLPVYHNGLPMVIEDGTDYYK